MRQSDIPDTAINRNTMIPPLRYSPALRITLRVGILMLLCLFLIQGCPAQGISVTSDDGSVTATWLRPLPQGNTLRELCFVSSREGWAVGDFGTILHTTDAGESWEAQKSGTREDLMFCSFHDRRQGWAGDTRLLLRTTDGGRHWAAVQGPPLRGERDNFRDIATPADGLAIIPTGDGGVWRSTDGGAQWTRVHEIYDPFQVFFSDAAHGWIAGANGRVIRTTDGGVQWTEHWIVGNSRFGFRFPVLLSFADSLRGWISTETDLYASGDGGRTWTWSPDSMRMTTGVAMLDTMRGWSCGMSGLRRTHDGGRTWVDFAALRTGWLEAIQFTTCDTGWTTGYNGLLLRTTDGGESWSGNAQDLRGFRSVHAPSADTLWAVGDETVRSTDGGRHWIPLLLPDSSFLSDAHFFDGRHGIACGSDGLVVSTSDAGLHWTPQCIAKGEHLVDVFFLDNLHGWIASLRGTIYRTADGGQRWTQLTDTLPGDLGRVVFTDAATGYAACLNGGFWRTRDGGRSWSSMAFGKALHEMVFPDTGTILLATTGTVLRSTDGGDTWRGCALDPESWPTGMHFYNSVHGCLLERDGKLWTTDDGGVTWQARPPAPTRRGMGIVTVAPTRAFVVAKGGGIMRVDLQR